MTRPAIFTIAASAPFARTLAQGLIARCGDDPLALSSAIIYLPTRRAARGFGEAFAQVMGGSALLPQFRALGDSEDDDLLFDAAADGLDLLPAITPLRRQLLLAKLIRQWDEKARDDTLSFAQAAALADSLAKVMDEAETQGVDLSQLKTLAPPDLAAHWEGVTRFLDVIQGQWPAILAAEGALNPAARRASATRALAKRLKDNPPDGMVIAAGSTGSLPATAELLGVIARLPRGAVVLPGLDRALDSESWDSLAEDPGHPQYGLRELLKRVDCERADVTDWHAAPVNSAREFLLGETLRPAPTTDAWLALRQSGDIRIAQGLENIALVTAADPEQESLAIALALREALDTPGRTAALVTPDRNLARRVAAQMMRWNIRLDDSAGRPLAHMSAGSFLCLLAEAASARFAPVPLLALLKHPFATLGQDPATFRRHARELDRWCLRGLRPDAGLDGIARAITLAGNARNPPPPAALDALAAWWQGVAALLSPLEALYARPEAALETLLETHVAVAEALTCDDPKDCRLYHNPDGEAAQILIDKLRDAAKGLPAIEPAAWPVLLRDLALKTPVRAGFGRHPRLSILGPLEARLQSFDLTVLGGLNEGSWPQGAAADPWFSRPMRRALGLEQPERGIGLSAHDFAMLAAGPCVLMTRDAKADGAPTIASRWLQRMQQLTDGLGLENALTPKLDYAALAASLREATPVPRLPRPAPMPPVEARPRRLTVTEIETWLRDPYAIYARHVLRLRPLDPLDQEVGPLERGNALHRALELFVENHPGTLPPDALEKLVSIAEQVFADMAIPKAALALWRPRFLSAARWFIAFEAQRRSAIAHSWLEKKGEITFAAPGGDFHLVARADRIDRMTSGGAAILDYKTGALPKTKDTATYLMPQLALEGAMLIAGGFEGVPALDVEELLYVKLSGGAKPGEERKLSGVIPAQALEKLASLVARFDDAATPYLPRLRPYRPDSDGDYDHLARVREWSSSGWSEDE